MTTLASERDATSELAGPALVAMAIAGLVLERRLLRASARTAAAAWPAAAGIVAFLSYGGPALFSGKATFSGYTHIVDIGHFFDLTARLAAGGRSPPDPVLSSFDEVVGKMLAVKYPGGSLAPLGSLADLARLDVPWAYQPFLAILGAVTALAAYSLLQAAIPGRPLRALAAAVAAQPSILYAYAVNGGVKELTTVSMLVLTTALLADRSPGRSPLARLIPTALAMAAMLAALTLAAAPWLGLLGAIGLAADAWLCRPRLVAVGKWLALGLMTVLLTLPTLLPGIRSAPTASPTGPQLDLGLGNLAEPVSLLSSFAIWITPDHRFPLQHPNLTYPFMAVVIVFALLGLLWAMRRGKVALAGLGVAGCVALPYVVARTGPWIELKGFAITSAITLLLACAGVGVLARGRHALAGWLAMVVIALGVALGNGVVYHSVTLAPTERFRDLEQIGEDYAGLGPAIYPGFEENAEYFLRKERATGLVNPPKGNLQLRRRLRLPPGQQYSYELDQLDYDFLQSFRLIVRRRTPTSGRPPSNWSLVRTTEFHEVWRRTGAPHSVVQHLPLRRSPSKRECDRFAAKAARAGPGAKLAYVRRHAPVNVNLVRGAHSPTWPSERRELVTLGQGEARAGFTLPRGGRFEVFLGGSVARGLSVSIDRRQVREISHRANYPGQFEYLGTRMLGSGRHEVLIERGGGNLLPGNGDGSPGRRIGPFVLVAIGRPAVRVRTATPDRALRLCREGRQLDWIEALRPESGQASRRARVKAEPRA